MFEFLPSIRVSFWLVRVGRMPRMCAATLPLFVKRHPYAQFPFLSSESRRSGGRARGDGYISWLVGVEGVARRNIPVDPSGLITSVGDGIVSCGIRCVAAFNGTDIHWRRWNGDGMDGSGDWGLYALSARITAIVASTLKGLGGKLKSFRLGGTIGRWLPNPNGIAGSLESESSVTIRGSGEATEEIVITFPSIVPGISVELRIARVLFRIGLPSSDDWCT